MLSGCSKDEILDHYNNIVQSAGAIELTGKSSLEGTKEKGIDDYTGTYTADYKYHLRDRYQRILMRMEELFCVYQEYYEA